MLNFLILNDARLIKAINKVIADNIPLYFREMILIILFNEILLLMINEPKLFADNGMANID